MWLLQPVINAVNAARDAVLAKIAASDQKRDQQFALLNGWAWVALAFKLDKMQATLDDLIKRLENPAPAEPGDVQLVVTSQGDSGMLQYTLTLPAPGASDVVKRTLTVNGNATEITDVTQAEVSGFEGNDGDTVSVSLADTDDAGNVSPTHNQTFTLTDTIPPSEPGDIGLVVTGEN